MFGAHGTGPEKPTVEELIMVSRTGKNFCLTVILLVIVAALHADDQVITIFISFTNKQFYTSKDA